MANKLVAIAKFGGDLEINCVDPNRRTGNLSSPASSQNGNRTTSPRNFLVSATILSTASTVFNAMLNSGFSESFGPSATGHRTVSLEDNSEALLIIFRALHHCNLQVPRQLTIEQLYNIANTLDKYDLYESLFPWLDIWCRKLGHRIGIDGKNADLFSLFAFREPGKAIKYADSRWLFISFVCRRGAIFKQETDYYMPRLRMMDKEEAAKCGEQEGTLTVARRGGTGPGTLGDTERWVVNPLAGLSDKILEELWAVRQKFVDPVIKKLLLCHHLHQTVAMKADGSTVCEKGMLHCDIMGSGILHRILDSFGIGDVTNEKEVEEVIGRFSIFDIRRIIENSTYGMFVDQHFFHTACQWLEGIIAGELSPEVLSSFKGLEPWGKTKKDKY